MGKMASGRVVRRRTRNRGVLARRWNVRRGMNGVTMSTWSELLEYFAGSLRFVFQVEGGGN